MCRKLIFLISFVVVLGLAGNAFAVTGNVWWGAQPQIDRFDPNNVEVGDIFYLSATDSVNTSDVNYTAAAATIADVVVGLKAAWNNSPNYLHTPINAANDIANSFLTLIGANSIPFSVTPSTTNGGAVDDQTLTRVAVRITNNYWSNTANWSDGNVPDWQHSVKFYLADDAVRAQYGVILDGAGTKSVYDVCGPAYDSNGVPALSEQILRIDAGTLEVTWDMQVATWADPPYTGRVVINPGATLEIRSGDLILGRIGTAIVDVNGGTLIIGSGVGISDMTVPFQWSGTTKTGAAVTPGTATVNLSSGTIYTETLSMYPWTQTGLIDIETGTLTVDDDVQSTLTGWASCGDIIGYGGIGYVNITNPGDTVVTATSAPNHAGNPSPLSWVTLDTAADPVVLKWRPGDDVNVVGGHDVYFGTDYADVYNADTTDITGIYLGRKDTNSLDISSLVELLSETTSGGITNYYSPAEPNYYWRVDEVNPGGTVREWPYLWTFRMPEYIVIDDFEDYDTDDALQISWGSYLQHPANLTNTDVWLAQTPAIDSNSMQFDYKNISAPFYSDTNTVFDPNEDWTAYGIEALALSFFGTAGNVAQHLYVELKDSYGGTKVVPYPGDANNVNEAFWHTWNIDLADFTGVDINHVAMLTIRAGDTSAAERVDESIYIDNVLLHPTRCLSGLVPGDFTGNCMADMNEMEELTEHWLDANFTVTPLTPDDDKLVLYYKLDGIRDDPCDPNTILDYGFTGDYDGQIDWINASEAKYYSFSTDAYDGNSWSTGSGNLRNGKISAEPNVWLDLDSDNLTVSAWIKMDASAIEPWDGFLWNAQSTTTGQYCMAVRYYLNSMVIWGGNGGPDYWHAWYFGIGGQSAGETVAEMKSGWHHVAFVKDYDAGMVYLYYDGEKATLYNFPDDGKVGGYNTFTRFGDFTPATYENFTIGQSGHAIGYESFEGNIDEFKIYEYALSASEVLGLSGAGAGTFYPTSPANLVYDGRINFKDYAVIAGDWLDEQLYP